MKVKELIEILQKTDNDYLNKKVVVKFPFKNTYIEQDLEIIIEKENKVELYI